jgi:release factor glutamine methyltransferase
VRKLIKYLVGKIYKPILERYLSKTRRCRYKGISLMIPPEVFHPGFFFTTKLLLEYINQLPLKEKTFLELGAGSGLISIFAAKKKANVTATDINGVAIEWLKKNSLANNACMQVIHSDLFQNISRQRFDIIAINPPFYKKDPVTVKDYAWYCGKNGEYFHGLFNSLANYIHNTSIVLMILSDGCDLEMINHSAANYGFHLNIVYSKQNLLETNFIFRIEVKKLIIKPSMVSN